MFGCSKANFCIGDGAEKKAFTTMLIRRPRQIKFQIKIVLRLIFPFTNPKYATIGAVIPAIISKFLPSKVINSGIALFRKSQNNTISTGILTIFKYVIFVKERLSINCRPFFIENKTIIVKSGGKIPNNNILGGNEFVSEL